MPSSIDGVSVIRIGFLSCATFPYLSNRSVLYLLKTDKWIRSVSFIKADKQEAQLLSNLVKVNVSNEKRVLTAVMKKAWHRYQSFGYPSFADVLLSALV